MLAIEHGQGLVEQLCTPDAFGFRGLGEHGVTLFARFAQFGEVFEILGGATLLIAGSAISASFGIGEEDGGKSLHPEVLLQLLVLLLDFLGLRLFSREVQHQEDIEFFGLLVEIFHVEDLAFEAMTPDAPIRSREVDEDVFPFLCRLALGCFEICEPFDVGGLMSREGCSAEQDCAEQEGFHGESSLFGKFGGRHRSAFGKRDVGEAAGVH